MNYTTQMDAAKKGIFTDKMEDVIERESISKEVLLEKIAQGKIVIPANIQHTRLKGRGIGEGLSTKVNVNLGVSEDCCDLEAELSKVNTAIDLKADSIMDLSTFGDTQKFRKIILEHSPVMLGTVPVYDTIAQFGNDFSVLKRDHFFQIVEQHADEGVDFLTIHAGLNLQALKKVRNNPRLTGVVSRGGSLLLAWMEKNNQENPFYDQFDRLLDICEKYDITLSLGDGLRPGSLADSTDAPQIQELITLGELTKEAWSRNVQVMIEGPGHVPFHEIATNIQLQKKLCHHAPFYVLGPLVTDIAPGYDHITSAIGGTLAGSAGADFLCYVTPAEHLRLPDLTDMKEGIMAVRIAAHAADIAKGIPGAIDWDHQMSQARANLDWQTMERLAIDSEKVRDYRLSSLPKKDSSVCTMCGDLCAIKTSNQVLKTNAG
ncbi:MAG: phosphomethylpyrimidine synthase ThiC [Spirochaetes bacterium]|nr:phosphomethylpyrimidine synthase ThiC [Spirochaetota bacterium]